MNSRTLALTIGEDSLPPPRGKYICTPTEDEAEAIVIVIGLRAPQSYDWMLAVQRTESPLEGKMRLAKSKA